MPSFKGRRWKLLGLSVVAIFAFASSAYVYWKISASPSSTLYVTATSPPLELRMELDKTEFQLNETITAHLFLKNIDDKVIKMIFPWVGNRFYFTVKASNGTLIYQSPRGVLQALDKATLDPNEVVQASHEWPKLRNILPNFDTPVGELQSKPVPPDSYMIIGHTEASPTLETPPITLTID